MDTIECIKKEYMTRSTSMLEDFVGCAIKHNIVKMTLNISQPHKIKKLIKDLMNMYNHL